MQLPAYNHTRDDHELLITTAAITPGAVRCILVEEFGYEVQAIGRGGEVARIRDCDVARWVFVVSPDDAQTMTGHLRRMA